MMRGLLVVFVAFAVAALLARTWLLSTPDPDVPALLGESAKKDGMHTSAFFRRVFRVAERGGWKKDEFFWYVVDEGYAFDAGAGRVLVVLRDRGMTIPGEDTEYLLLVGPNGRLLDRLDCAISNRLTQWSDSGRYFTESDGDQFVVRFVPHQPERDFFTRFEHTIHLGAWYARFRWGETVPSKDLQERGLCRVTVRGDRFELVWPKPEHVFDAARVDRP